MWRKNWKVISLALIALITRTVALWEYREIYILNDRLACVATWIEKSKSLHTIRMKEPANFTGDSMRKLMDSVNGTYDCTTMEPSYSRMPHAKALSDSMTTCHRKSESKKVQKDHETA